MRRVLVFLVIRMAGYTVKLVNQWLTEHAFMPIIALAWSESLRIRILGAVRNFGYIGHSIFPV